MATKVHVIFYSMYGHIYRMAEAVVAGARQVPGTEVTFFQVPALVPDEILEKRGAKAARKVFAHLPFARVEYLPDADAIIFGTPTRFGNMASQMRNVLDQTGGLWVSGALVGKVGSVFISTASQRGGQGTTITCFHSTLFSSWDDCRRCAVYAAGSQPDEGNQRRHPVWGFNTGWKRRLAATFRERAGSRALPGPSCS
jgi:NAD(P)H:quinone oxidoreductase type IV